MSLSVPRLLLNCLMDLDYQDDAGSIVCFANPCAEQVPARLRRMACEAKVRGELYVPSFSRPYSLILFSFWNMRIYNVGRHTSIVRSYRSLVS